MIDNLKIYLLNAGVFIFSLSKAEAGLKIVLLLFSIIYTGMKIIDWIKGKKDETTK
jgi:hypothetical protein